MLAILGEIEVQLQTGFTALEATLGSEFAEQARIGRKPGLQWVGDKADEYSLSVRFHQQYCQPTAQCLEVNISLREFTGDLRQPLKPPAIATTLNRKAAGITQAIATGTPLSRAVSLARQAQSALTTTSQAIRVARQMKTDPVAALTRVPGVMNSLGEAATPLIPCALVVGRPGSPFSCGQSPDPCGGQGGNHSQPGEKHAWHPDPQYRPGTTQCTGYGGRSGGRCGVSTWNDVTPVLIRLMSHLVTRR